MTAVDTVGLTTTSSTSTSTITAESSQISEEFDMFLQMLTAQVENQDPLEPLDSTQFVEQLATFSSLEQEVKTNDTLESIADTLNSLHMLLANDWLGETITVESSWVPYNGAPVEFQLDLPDGIDSAELQILDSEGKTVFDKSLDLSAETYSWSGDHIDGADVQSGDLFQIGIAMYQDGDYIGTTAPLIITEVTDISSDDGKVRLGTSSYLSADVDAVRKLGDE